MLNRRWIEVDTDSGELSFEDYGVGLDTCPIVLDEPSERILGVVNA